MKKKNVAGILALFAGSIGVHRFYLGQVGLGLAYLFLVPFLVAKGFWLISLIGVLDAIIFFSMDRKDFDVKYNDGRQHNEWEERKRNRRRRNSPQRQEPKTHQQPNRRYETTMSKPKLSKSKSAAFLKEGIKKFKDYDYEAAIEDFEQALKNNPQHVATHFNLACAQSLMENKDKAFYHLDRAVALGFDDINAIKTRDHLAYIRIQPEFDHFEANGFRLAKQMKAKQVNDINNEPTIQSPPKSPDLLEQLHRLAQLKEKGLLTEQEFSTQKEKLLR